MSPPGLSVSEDAIFAVWELLLGPNISRDEKI